MPLVLYSSINLIGAGTVERKFARALLAGFPV
jgi:hypothetical protein